MISLASVVRSFFFLKCSLAAIDEMKWMLLNILYKSSF